MSCFLVWLLVYPGPDFAHRQHNLGLSISIWVYRHWTILDRLIVSVFLLLQSKGKEKNIWIELGMNQGPLAPQAVALTNRSWLLGLLCCLFHLFLFWAKRVLKICPIASSTKTKCILLQSLFLSKLLTHSTKLTINLLTTLNNPQMQLSL